MGACGNNCTSWQNNGPVPEYHADPDIAGIGNMMVFVASAALVLLLSLAHYILTISDAQSRNRIDILLCRALRGMGFSKIARSKRDFWIPVIKKVVLGLSDQQLLTGLAVLIAGFWTHCSISVYHFTLVNDLAWFSANAHLTTLGLLDGFFQDNPVLRNWRAALMVAFAILLAASTVMEGHYQWDESWPYDAQCLFDDLIGNIGGVPGFWMGVNLAGICIFYPINIIVLYQRPRELCATWLLSKPIAALDNAIKHLQNRKSDANSPTILEGSVKRFSFTLQIFFFSTISWIYFALIAFVDSPALGLLLDTTWFAYGVRSVLKDREIPASLIDGNENAMTFGQIVPILLLSSIVLVFREAYDDQSKKMQENQQYHPNSSQRSLVRTRGSAVASSTATTSFEMSGGIQDSEDDIELEIPPPRRVDTEMGGRSHTSTFEGRQLQRRPTYPPTPSDTQLGAEESQ